MQTLAAHGYAADSIDQAALQKRLKDAKFRDVVIALTDIRRQPPLQQSLASHIVDNPTTTLVHKSFHFNRI